MLDANENEHCFVGRRSHLAFDDEFVFLAIALQFVFDAFVNDWISYLVYMVNNQILSFPYQFS